MKFVKAQVNGNDFVIVNSENCDINSLKVKSIADRVFGIGCDQVVFIKKVSNDYKVDFFNRDGSYADMCGNGLCAASKYIKKIYQEDSNEINLLTSKSIYRSKIEKENVSAFFDMPKKVGNVILTGNKHIVTSSTNLSKLNELLKVYSDCNLHFIDIISKNEIRMKSFERGVGWTLACGSGAIAVAFSSNCKGKINIIHEGGKSVVEILNKQIILTTIPKLVFEGSFYD
ncbi:MAG: hypothetical protein LBI95_03305 [Holosporales bacterium]|jgi:diaminopimelate epimerase|nr:hypothetical protein [Holosporales bacterium]